MAQNLVYGIAGIVLCLLGFALVVLQDRRLSAYPSLKERIGGAILGGLGVWLATTGGLLVITYIGFQYGEHNADLGPLPALLCFATPLSLLAMIGLFVRSSTTGPIKRYFSKRLEDVADNASKRGKS